MGVINDFLEFCKSVILHAEFHRYFSYTLFIIMVYVFRGIFWQDRHAIIKKLKGENGDWDTLEVAFIAWIIVWVTVMSGDLFFDLNLTDGAWWSLDTVGLLVLTGKKGPELLMAMRGKGMNMQSFSKETITEEGKEVVKKTTVTQATPKKEESENLDNIGT